MLPSASPLAQAIQGSLLSFPGVVRLSALRRSTPLFAQGQSADALYYIEEGLIKLSRVGGNGERVILTLCGPGELVGEESLGGSFQAYEAEAEILTNSNVYRVPHNVIRDAIHAYPDLALHIMGNLLHRRSFLIKKIELLCLQDVEFRILHYLSEFSRLVKPGENGEGYSIPITQLELADLIGATRETTSTTLNQLERRGLIRLGRRLLNVPAPDLLQQAALSELAVAAASASVS